MRKIRYVVATSLDGYIARPNGEKDWIASDPEIDFAALTVVISLAFEKSRTRTG